MATTRQPLKPITDPVSPVHRLRLTVSRRGRLWYYELHEDGRYLTHFQRIREADLSAGPDESTAMIYATGKALEEVGITANFCDFRVKAEAATATIEVLAIEGVNILVAHPDDDGRFYHADADDIPLAIAHELAETIRGMNWEACDRYIARNGRRYRWGSKPQTRPPQPQPRGQTMTEQPNPFAPTAAELEAARRIGEALCLIPPQQINDRIAKLIDDQRKTAEQFNNLYRLHTDTLDALGNEVRPFFMDVAKRFADIEARLEGLRQDCTFVLDQLGFRPFEARSKANEPPTDAELIAAQRIPTAPIPDTPDGPPMT